MAFTVDPEVRPAVQPLIDLLAGLPPDIDIIMRRTGVEAMVDYVDEQANFQTPDVSITKFHAPSADGYSVPLHWITKSGSQPGSAMLYLHGGGMIAASATLYDNIVSRVVSTTGVPALSVDFRSAPEKQAPTMVEDALAGLNYLHEHASELGVSPTRIAVVGDSGGGCIAAALTHLVKHKGGPAIAKAILFNPMLEDRISAEDKDLAKTATWDFNNNKFAWDSVLGDRAGKDGVKPWEAPARMTDATGLPPHYIDVGQLDILRDEIIDYVLRLSQAGIPCEFHMHPGCVQGFEVLQPTANVSQRTQAERHRVIGSL